MGGKFSDRMSEKSVIRRILSDRLRQFPVALRSSASSQICSSLADSPLFSAASSIFAFLPLPTEPDLTSLISEFPEKRWSFPRIIDDHRICFHRMNELREAIPGRFGLLEPDPNQHPVTLPIQADLILVPGCGFDPETKQRIGHGRGYYDRFLTEALQSPKSPVLIGIGFSVQRFTGIPVANHDIPVNRILTEEGWL